MPFNTITVSTAITPTVIETYFSHYLNRKPLRQKPTAHISYHEGLRLIRQFLYHASHHTVEDIQAFTSQWVPSPRWVKVDDLEIPQKIISEAADALISQLSHKGIDKVGGSQWWQWRRKGGELKAEWIEMRGDYDARKKKGDKGTRVMLYVHGGAYFFGSVDEHRYQMQRHARKLRARVFAPRYRLAPQFPFPCGLHDCLAAYLYLLTVQEPTEIILAGDSAGGGMVVSMLVTLRDRGLSLPAGAILISPWVDLTHSFPSVAGENAYDYIPSHGFMQRPSASWPPPNSEEIEEIAKGAIAQTAGNELPRHSTQMERKEAEDAAVQGFAVYHNPANLNPCDNPDNPAGTANADAIPGNTIPGPGHNLSIMLDGNLVEIKDQIQMYATNQLISQPLVSPVLQPSLGGLPPLLIMTGGGEVLRDEQIYLAHKAAHPAKYPPGEAYLDEYDSSRDILHKYKPTDVQLQVWDDLCHVAPTLSFSRPAKFMYRSIAQFGAWALARAQKTEIEILDDDDVSVISSGSDMDGESPSNDLSAKRPQSSSSSLVVGKAGDPLPPFRSHMIRQRVDRHGALYPLAPVSALPGLQVPANEVGVIKPGPVRKWITAKKEWDYKYASQRRRVQKQRIKDMVNGLEGFGGDEVPPPSALAGRRKSDKEDHKKRGKSWGMMLWSLWGSKHDEKTIEREEKADREPDTTTTTASETTDCAPKVTTTTTSRPRGISIQKQNQHQLRSRSRRRTVSDTGQTEVLDELRKGYIPGMVSDVDENTSAAELLERKSGEDKIDEEANASLLSPAFIPSRMKHLRVAEVQSMESTEGADRNASTIAVVGAEGVASPVEEEIGAEQGQTPGNRSEIPERFETANEAL